MKSTDEISKIPRTGRIGRFAKIVESKAGKDSFLKIMEKSDEYAKYKPEKKAPTTCTKCHPKKKK